MGFIYIILYIIVIIVYNIIIILMKIKKRTVRRIKKNNNGYRARKSRGGRQQQTSRRNPSSYRGHTVTLIKPVIDHEFRKYISKYTNSKYMVQLTTLIELFGDEKNQKYAQQLFSKSNYTDDKIVKIIRENSSITTDDITKLQNFNPHSLAIVVGGAAAPASPAALEDDLCAICLISLTGEVVEGCTGRHRFHEGCLKAWVDTQAVTCPTCRGVIDQNLIQRLRNLPTTSFHVFIARLIPIRYLPIATLIGLLVLTVSIMMHLILEDAPDTGNRNYITILWWIANLLSSVILLH